MSRSIVAFKSSGSILARQCRSLFPSVHHRPPKHLRRDPTRDPPIAHPQTKQQSQRVLRVCQDDGQDAPCGVRMQAAAWPQWRQMRIHMTMSQIRSMRVSMTISGFSGAMRKSRLRTRIRTKHHKPKRPKPSDPHPSDLTLHQASSKAAPQSRPPQPQRCQKDA